MKRDSRLSSSSSPPPPAILKGGRYLAPDGEFVNSDLWVAEGKIQATPGPGGPGVGLGNAPGDPPGDSLGNAPGASCAIVDLEGLQVVPGMIDPHVHFREPGDRHREGISNGSLAALHGGVTTVLDMPNNRPPCTTPARLEHKRDCFSRRCRVNWGLHLQATLHQAASGDGLPAHAASAKAYLSAASAAPAIVGRRDLETVFRAFKLVTLHGEDETCFRAGCRHHHETRPREAVLSALRCIEQAYAAISPADRPRLVLCHVSTAEEVAWLAEKKRAGWAVAGETAPHYLLYTKEKYMTDGPWFQVNPPLRDATDRDALWRGVVDGTIDFLGSDHAPHPPDLKERAERPPSGIAGIEWSGPLLYSWVDAGRLTWRRWHEATVTVPGRVFGIPGRHGLIAGNWADLVVLSPRLPTARPVSGVVSKTGFHPYAGVGFSREVLGVMVNGAWALLTPSLADRFVSRSMVQPHFAQEVIA